MLPGECEEKSLGPNNNALVFYECDTNTVLNAWIVQVSTTLTGSSLVTVK